MEALALWICQSHACTRYTVFVQDEIICTAWLVATYLRDFLKFDGKTYIVGGPAMVSEFESKELSLIGPGVSQLFPFIRSDTSLVNTCSFSPLCLVLS